MRFRLGYKNHVWSYDFVAERTSGGKAIRIPNIIERYIRGCLAITVGRKITVSNIICTVANLFLECGRPKFIRSDNGPEYVAKLVRLWLNDLDVQTEFIETGLP